MSIVSRTNSLQAYHTILYRKAVHPEFFRIEGRRRIVHSEYEFESWVFRGGHTLLFQFAGVCLSEIITERPDSLSDRGQVSVLPCAGERDYEEIISDRIEYVTSVQTETLPEHLYLATCKELREHAATENCLLSEWTNPTERHCSMSMIDMQRYHDDVHVQAYHLRGDCALVLRSQTIFTALDEAVTKAREAEKAEKAEKAREAEEAAEVAEGVEVTEGAEGAEGAEVTEVTESREVEVAEGASHNQS